MCWAVSYERLLGQVGQVKMKKKKIQNNQTHVLFLVLLNVVLV